LPCVNCQHWNRSKEKESTINLFAFYSDGYGICDGMDGIPFPPDTKAFVEADYPSAGPYLITQPDFYCGNFIEIIKDG